MEASANAGTVAGAPRENGFPGAARLWLGLFGAPLAWSLQAIVGYALTTVPCGTARGELGPGISTAGASLVLSAAALAWAVLSLFIAWSNVRAAPGNDERGPGADPLERARTSRIHFMGHAGLIVGGIFLFGVVLDAILQFALVPCR